MEIKTHLNKAAYLLLQGAELISFEGKNWWNCKVIVRTTQEALQSAREGMVKYKDYMHMRTKLKKRMYKAFNKL